VVVLGKPDSLDRALRSKAEPTAADSVTSSWECRCWDGGGSAGATPGCGFRKNAKRDRTTSALFEAVLRF